MDKQAALKLFSSQLLGRQVGGVSEKMSPLLINLAALALGFGLGLLAMVIRGRLPATDVDQSTEVPAPLNAAAYAEWLEGNRKRYLNAMGLYDKLVPWASGGALVISLSFVSSLAPLAPPWSKWVLGAAWLSLVGALLSSIRSQYSSTRIQVWSASYMAELQHPPETTGNDEALDKWRNETLEFKRRTHRSAQNTKLLNELAGILLAVGLLLLGVFGIAAVPFGVAVQP